VLLHVDIVGFSFVVIATEFANKSTTGKLLEFLLLVLTLLLQVFYDITAVFCFCCSLLLSPFVCLKAFDQCHEFH